MQTYGVGFSFIKINLKFPDRSEGCNTKLIFQDGDREETGKQVRKDGKRKEK